MRRAGRWDYGDKIVHARGVFLQMTGYAQDSGLHRVDPAVSCYAVDLQSRGVLFDCATRRSHAHEPDGPRRGYRQ